MLILPGYKSNKKAGFMDSILQVPQTEVVNFTNKFPLSLPHFCPPAQFSSCPSLEILSIDALYHLAYRSDADNTNATWD